MYGLSTLSSLKSCHAIKSFVQLYDCYNETIAKKNIRKLQKTVKKICSHWIPKSILFLRKKKEVNAGLKLN